MRFRTESGSEYEVRQETGGVRYIRRVNTRDEKRADGEWVRLLNNWHFQVGEPALLLMESLSDYGPDDYGFSGGTGVTTRTTTRIVEVSDE